MTEYLKKKLTDSAVKWAAVAVFTCAISYVVLASDARNDRRYVQIETYRADRERDRELSQVLNSQVQEKFQGTEKKLDEISSDVKALLKESRKQ